MTLDPSAIVQAVLGALLLFVGGLVWRTSITVQRIDVTLHGEKGDGGMASRVKQLGERMHKVESQTVGLELVTKDNANRIKALESRRRS